MRQKKAILNLLLLFTLSSMIQAQNINVSGTIATNTTWDADAVDTVKITGNVLLDTGVVLTIDPGIVVDFTANYYVNVQGSIYAQGAENDSIRFTTSDTSGYASNSHHGWSGLRYYDTRWDSSRFAYCIFEYGKADSTHAIDMPGAGGALYLYSSFDISLNHSVFRHNYAINQGAAIYAYYVFVDDDTNQVISDVTFQHNESENNLGTFYSERNYYLSFDNCLFTHNMGRAIVSDKSSSSNHVHPNITDSRFAYNTGSDGGALALLGDGSSAGLITRTLFHNNYATGAGGAIFNFSYEFQLANSILVNNEADGNGGAIYARNAVIYGNSNSFLTNNTIAYNKAHAGGGLYMYELSSGDLSINKIIFYNNESTSPSSINNDVYNGYVYAYPEYYGCSFTTDLTDAGNTGFTLENIFNANPAFISPSSGIGKDFDGYSGRNWRPDWCISPCIDTGHTAYSENFSEYNDFANRTRVINGTSDIGAYEAPHGFTVMPADMEFCEGDSAYFFMDRTAVGSVEWELSTDKGLSFTPTGSSSDTLLIAESATMADDSIMVRLEAAFNGCAASYTDTFMIRIYENPVVTASSDADICLGDTIDLKYQGEGVKSWGFSHANHTYTVSGANNDSIALVTQDSVSVYAQSNLQQSASKTCYSYDTIQVNVYPVPAYDDSDFLNTYQLCEGDSVQIAIDTGYTYLWSTGQTSHAIFVDTVTADTLWVTDEYGCTNEFDFEVVEYSSGTPYKPSANIDLGPDTTYCEGLGVYLSAPALANAQYLWSDSSQGSQLYVTEPGTYAVRVINHLDCYSYDTVHIDFEMMNSLALDDTAFCYSNSVNLPAPEHLTSIKWRDLDSNYMSTPYTVSAQGNYVITGDSSGCHQIDTIMVTELAEFTVDIGPDTLKLCGGETLTFGLDMTDPQLSTYFISDFSTTLTDDSLTVEYDPMQPTTAIAVTATDTNGCEATDRIELIDNRVVNSAANFPTINDPEVSFSIAGIPDNADSYYWDFGDTISDISTEASPTHTYPYNGSFEACLYVENECNTDPSCFTFDIFNASTVGIFQSGISDLSVYPVPVKHELNIDLGGFYGNILTKLFSTDGRKVLEDRFSNVSRIRHDISDLKSGNYVLMIQADNKHAVVHIVKE